MLHLGLGILVVGHAFHMHDVHLRSYVRQLVVDEVLLIIDDFLVALDDLIPDCPTNAKASKEEAHTTNPGRGIEDIEDTTSKIDDNQDHP